MSTDKKTVVVFLGNNARVLVNPADGDRFKNKSNCLIDPDLSNLRGVPLHFWKKMGDSVVQKTRTEKVATLLSHKVHGVDHDMILFTEKPTSWLKPTLFLTFVLLTAFLARAYFHV